MKVFANNKVYVQKNDLAYFMRGAEGVSIPSSIVEKVFGQIFIVTDENRYEFIEFSSPKEIEFFRNCDWMIDYNMFDEMTEEEIVNYGCQINTERNNVAAAFNALDDKEKAKQYTQTLTKIQLLEFKMASVRDVLWHKQGHLKFDLPKGIDLKTQTQNQEQTTKKETAFQKILRKYKKR